MEKGEMEGHCVEDLMCVIKRWAGILFIGSLAYWFISSVNSKRDGNRRYLWKKKEDE